MKPQLYYLQLYQEISVSVPTLPREALFAVTAEPQLVRAQSAPAESSALMGNVLHTLSRENLGEKDHAPEA